MTTAKQARIEENTMKLRAFLVTLSLVIGSLVFSSPAHAAGCVTKAEYRQLRNGMSQKQVSKIFGTPGNILTQSSGFGTSIVMRDYKTCSPYRYGSVSIMFTNNRLDTKSALWM